MQGSARRIRALMRKEVLQLKQDHRTLALMLMIPMLWLILFGYAATFDVKDFRAVLVDQSGGQESAEKFVDALEARGYNFDFEEETKAQATEHLKRGDAVVALIIDGSDVDLVIDGSDVISAQGAARAAQRATQLIQSEAAQKAPPKEQVPGEQAPGQQVPRSSQPGSTPAQVPIVPKIDILYNPDLESADFMIPGLIGMIILFVGGLMTSLGVVRERERGTLEQLIATPLRPFELVVGKVMPYAVLALVDLVLVMLLGVFLFGVPFRGDLLTFILVSFFFLLAALGIGLLVSSVSQNQQQAMQTSVFILFPQFLLSGLIFPIEAIPWGIRWITYLMPLTYFVPVARGIFLKGLDFTVLWPQALILFGYAAAMMTLASLRFRSKGMGR